MCILEEVYATNPGYHRYFFYFKSKTNTIKYFLSSANHPNSIEPKSRELHQLSSRPNAFEITSCGVLGYGSSSPQLMQSNSQGLQETAALIFGATKDR